MHIKLKGEDKYHSCLEHLDELGKLDEWKMQATLYKEGVTEMPGNGSFTPTFFI